MSPQEVSILPPTMLQRGPDIIRGSGLAFIATRYPDPEGRRFFVEPGRVGHEQMTNSPGMLQALFGPHAEEYTQELVTLKDVYKRDDRGNFVPTGEKRENYDYFEIRRRAKRDNLFGRMGRLMNRDVVMLWNAPEDWQSLLKMALESLGVDASSNAIVTVGTTNQFLAKDFFGSEDEQGRKKSQIDADQAASQERLELLSRYHVAQGAEKDRLARTLGLHQNDIRPNSPADWRRQGWKQNVPYTYSYGERQESLNFRRFVENFSRKDG